MTTTSTAGPVDAATSPRGQPEDRSTTRGRSTAGCGRGARPSTARRRSRTASACWRPPGTSTISASRRARDRPVPRARVRGLGRVQVAGGRAFEMARAPSAELRASAETLIELVAAGARRGRVSHPRTTPSPSRAGAGPISPGHELYCAGHLIQAAIAYRRATGDDRLLAIARRFVEYIHTVFGPGGAADRWPCRDRDGAGRAPSRDRRAAPSRPGGVLPRSARARQDRSEPPRQPRRVPGPRARARGDTVEGHAVRALSSRRAWPTSTSRRAMPRCWRR